MIDFLKNVSWLIIYGLMKAAYDLVDTVFIGKSKDPTIKLAALGISYPVINMAYAVTFLVIVGGTLYMGEVMKESDSKSGNRIKDNKKESGIGKYFFATLICGAAMSVILAGLSFFWICRLDTDEAVINEAKKYLFIRSIGCISTVIICAYGVIKKINKQTFRPMFVLLCSLLVNGVLTYYLLVKRGLGLNVVAIARITADTVVIPYIIYDLLKDGLKIKNIKYDNNVFKAIITLGANPFITQFVTSLGFYFLQVGILQIGNEYSAAFSVGNKISNLSIQPVVASSGYVAAQISGYKGKDLKSHVKKINRYGFFATLLISFAGMFVLGPQRQRIIGYITQGDKKFTSVMLNYTSIALIGAVFLNLMYHFEGVLNGLGRTKKVLLIEIVWIWLLRIPIVIYFIENSRIVFNIIGLGEISGIWLGLLFSNVIVACLAFLEFLCSI